MNTAKDIVDRNITLIVPRQSYTSLATGMFQQNISEWKQLAMSMKLFLYDYEYCRFRLDEYDFECPDWGSALIDLGYNKSICYSYRIKNNIHGDGTEALYGTHLHSDALKLFPKEKWWRVKEFLPGGNPFSGWVTWRQWTFNEVTFSLSLDYLRLIIARSWDYFY